MIENHVMPKSKELESQRGRLQAGHLRSIGFAENVGIAPSLASAAERLSSRQRRATNWQL
jgi:hypothetical protein